MDQTTGLVLLIVAAVLGITATAAILRRNERAASPDPPESPYATAQEGMKRCPSCGIGNLVTDDTCSSCGRRLPR